MRMNFKLLSTYSISYLNLKDLFFTVLFSSEPIIMAVFNGTYVQVHFFVIIFMIHTATILPFRLCFYDETDENLDILESLINYFFVIDITVNLFSAYYD